MEHNHKTLFFNREIGWLKFNKRVLFQAHDPRNPLLERIRFLDIFNSNLDEFFMKRVGGLKRHYLAKVHSNSLDGLTPLEQLNKIRTKVQEFNQDIHNLLQTELLPSLKTEKINLLTWADLTNSEQQWAEKFFNEKIFPVLTPMAVDLGHPFPLISNLSTSLAVSLQSPKKDEDLLFARIKIPDVFPAWLQIQTDHSDQFRFISTIDIVRQFLPSLFPHMQIQQIMAFRITRNVDILSDAEGAEDLLELIEEEVKQRRFAEVVRLEHGPNPDPWLLQFLIEELELTTEDVYEFSLPLEYKQLTAIQNLPLSKLKFKTWSPITSPPLTDEDINIFNVIRNSDLLLHHPYENFSTSVERFICTASTDPDVIAIKMTLYRTSEESPIVHALIRAAEEGKQVVCLIELKARFDEEQNIYWAQEMENAGVHVVYGIVGLKTHAKIALVVRRERDEFKTYAHIGTGNYHPQTARLYTDFGLLTSRSEITSELVEVFHYLTGRSLKSNYHNLMVAPINLKSSLLQRIENETENAKKGLASRIIAKCNSLEDRDIIKALYRASQAGVKINLIIRGFSCLKPQVPGLSQNISLISIIGQFLEHSRIFYFRNAQQNELDGEFFIGSADLMSRNLLGRVEVVAPILDKSNREKIWDALNLMLNDKKNAWDLEPNGDYRLRQPKAKDEELGSQEMLMEKTKQRLLLMNALETENPASLN